jgi:hypothetical protein
MRLVSLNYWRSFERCPLDVRLSLTQTECIPSTRQINEQGLQVPAGTPVGGVVLTKITPCTTVH